MNALQNSTSSAGSSAASTGHSAHGQPHPSPHHALVLGWNLWFAIVGAPMAWVMQLTVNSVLAGNACYPHDVPLAQPAWAGLLQASTAVEAVALLICLWAGATAWRNWRRSRAEAPGDGHQAIASGDGRTRFMAMVGLMSSGVFFLATLIAFGFIGTVPPCSG